MSILEAFAYGKPVIGANLGSVPELVENGVTGLLFEPKDNRDLAEKIKSLFQDPKMAKKMGRRARRKVEEIYSAEKYYPKLMQIYEELIRNGRAEHGRLRVSWN